MYIWNQIMRNITKYKGHMKRTTFAISTTFLCLFAILSFVSSCEVDHFYEAEITVVNPEGTPINNAHVSLEVDVDGPDTLPDDKKTASDGTVEFSFDNVGIMKVKAEKENASGESMLILKEDKKVELTVIVYDVN